MEYVIKSIKHTGRRGERFTERTDDRYPIRIGRTVDFSHVKIEKGSPMLIRYLKNKDGSDYSNMQLLTSNVVDFRYENGMFTIETMNSIYEFVRCG